MSRRFGSGQLIRGFRSFSSTSTRYNNQPAGNNPPRSSTTPDFEAWKSKFNGAKEQLLIWGQLNSTLLRQRANNFSSQASVSLQGVGGKLNQVTGYHEIEALKKRVVDVEKRISSLREEAKDAKIAYESAVTTRSSGQREVNDLLQRKSSWSDNDVLRFTSLVRQDHLNEQTEATSKIRLAEAEAAVENQFNELMQAILSRYHEEQVWSDKIRSASTYGSLLALGMNVVVFVLAIVLVEPYKRKRLAQTFEKRIEEISQQNQAMIQAGMADLSEHFIKQEAVLSQIAGVALAPPPSSDLIMPVNHEPPETIASIEIQPHHPFSDLQYLLVSSKEQLVAVGVGSLVGGGLVALVMSIARS